MRASKIDTIGKLFFAFKLLAELAMAIDGFALPEIFQFEELAQFYFAILSFVRSRSALGPFEGFFTGFYLDDPIAGDEFLGFGERAVNDTDALAAGIFDPCSFGAGLEATEVE